MGIRLLLDFLKSDSTALLLTFAVVEECSVIFVVLGAVSWHFHRDTIIHSILHLRILKTHFSIKGRSFIIFK